MVKVPNGTGKVVNSMVTAEDTAPSDAALTPRLMDEGSLREIGSLADARALYAAMYGEDIVEASEELGDGFDRFSEDDKRKLVGVPLFVMEWKFSTSETVTRDGELVEYVSCRIVGERGGKTIKAVFADGGTGIYSQLRAYTNRTGRTRGMMVPNGLRVSDYTFTNPMTGEKSPASTYYFDLSE